MSSSSTPAVSTPTPTPVSPAASAPAWIATAPPAFLRSAGPFVGPTPVPKDNSSVNVLITGAARGIGLELAQQYAAANSASIVFAAVRDPKAQTIVSLAAKYSNIVIVQLDVTSDASINASFAQVSKVVDHLDILINNAGVLGNLDLPTATSREHLLSVMNTNAAGPMVVTQKYLPLLKSAKKLPSRVINVSSGLGSNAWAPTAVTAFGSKLSNAYCVSKAAMNYLTNIFAASVPEVIFVSVHPGWVETDMAAESAPGAPVKPKDSAQALRALIESRESKHSGLFFDNIDNGAQLPF